MFRVITSSLVLVSATVALPAEPVVRLSLPPPHTRGAVSVETALHERRSLRSPAPTPLSLEEVGQLCWAAQGVTDDQGHRTAPSAHAAYPLEVYVLAGAVDGVPPGLYRYLPGAHALVLLRAGDPRADFERRGVGQSWVARAPAIFVITGTLSSMSSMGDRAAQFMAIEAGLAAQGLFLQAEALGLGSTFVGGYRPKDARQALALREGEEVLGVLPVGRRRE